MSPRFVQAAERIHLDENWRVDEVHLSLALTLLVISKHPDGEILVFRATAVRNRKVYSGRGEADVVMTSVIRTNGWRPFQNPLLPIANQVAAGIASGLATIRT